MRWLIDGYNVIRRDPDLRGEEARGLEAGRRALLALAAARARGSADRFVVVFDGAPGPGRGAGATEGRLQVIFTRPPESADDRLIALARQAGAGSAVVSSDRRVLDAARRAGSAAVTAEQFLARLDRGGRAGEDAVGGGEDADRDDAEPAPRVKRGNPRRRSKAARAAARALGRLGK